MDFWTRLLLSLGALVGDVAEWLVADFSPLVIALVVTGWIAFFVWGAVCSFMEIPSMLVQRRFYDAVGDLAGGIACSAFTAFGVMVAMSVYNLIFLA